MSLTAAPTLPPALPISGQTIAKSSQLREQHGVTISIYTVRMDHVGLVMVALKARDAHGALIATKALQFCPTTESATFEQALLEFIKSVTPPCVP